MPSQLNFIVRPAKESDALGIAKVHVETWQSAYRDQIPQEILNGLSIQDKVVKWTKTIVTADPRKSLLVAVSEGEIVGFSIVGPSRDIDLSDFGEQSAIYVRPAFQGHGIGLALMDAGINFLKEQGYSKAMLWVLKTNTKTINFYVKHGWVADGTEKEEIKDGYSLQEVRYRKEL